MAYPHGSSSGSLWHRLTTDVDVKRQVLSAAAIAALLGVFELVFFLRVVVPTVRSGIVGLLYGTVPVTLPDWASRGMGAMVGVAHEREHELVRRNNHYALFLGVLIVALPVTLIGVLLTRNPILRREGRAHVLFDVLLVFGCLAAFQVMFFFMGRLYSYTSSPEMVHDLVHRYNETFDQAAERAGPPPPLTPEEKLKLTRTAVEMAQTYVLPAVSDYIPTADKVERMAAAVDAALRSYANNDTTTITAATNWANLLTPLLTQQPQHRA